MAFVHFLVEVYHSHLYDVGGGPLHRHIYRHALSSLPDLSVGGVDFGDEAFSPQQRLNIALFPCLLFGGLKVLSYPGVFFKV